MCEKLIDGAGGMPETTPTLNTDGLLSMGTGDGKTVTKAVATKAHFSMTGSQMDVDPQDPQMSIPEPVEPNMEDV